MGRTVLADESIQNYTLQLFKAEKWQIGLIIGQLTTQKDYLVRLVRTPEPAEDVCSEEEEVDLTPKKKRKKSPQKPDSLAKIDEKWTATHAKQVCRMLPGGLDVIGVFAMAPPSMMQDAQSKLRQALYSIHKTLKKTQIVEEVEADSISDRILLQICSETRKFTCKSIDVADPKSTFRPAEMKIQTSGEKWLKLESKLSLNVQIAVSTKDQNQPFLKQIQNGITPFCKSLHCGLVTVNGQLRSTTELLDQSQSESKRSKGRDKGQTTPQQTYNIDYLVQQHSSSTDEDPVVCECASSIVIRGQIHGRAYVPSRATVGEAVQAMTCDLIRSICARTELLCEDIELVEEDTVRKELYDTPVRVFGKLSESQLQFCDYMFQDEKLEEVTDRIKDLLDITVSGDGLDLTCERVATEVDWAHARQEEEKDTEEEEEEGGRSSLKDLGLRIGAAVAGLVAVVVAGASYLFTGNDT